MNYYPHHIGDYSRHTSHLSWLEDIAYRRMLDLYYTSERPLPLNIDGLYRLIRATRKEEKLAVDAILAEFFHKTDSGWANKRADEEISKSKEKSDSARESARMRWQCERNANAMRTQCDGNAPNSQEPKANTKDKGISLPPWVPEGTWKDWLEVRSKVKAPNTTRALSLALAELQRLRDEGHDPKAVLELAITRGWKGLFPTKQQAQAVKVDL